MKNYFIIILALSFNSIFSQGVGINTTNPVSKLDVVGLDNDIPTLRIEPQVNPTGSTYGDLSVIGDKLYKYDSLRGKWLSIESSLYNFATSGNAQVRLEYTGDIEISGPIVPMDATIVSIAINADSGTRNKGIQLLINGVNVANNNESPNNDGLLNMNDFSYLNNNYNLDLKKGDSIMIRLENGTGRVRDVKVELILKWR